MEFTHIGSAVCVDHLTRNEQVMEYEKRRMYPVAVVEEREVKVGEQVIAIGVLAFINSTEEIANR